MTPGIPPSRTSVLAPPPITVSGTVCRESRKKGGEIVAVRGLEQYVGEAAGAKPGMPADRCVRYQFAARRWQG